MAATKAAVLLLLFATVYGENCPPGSTYRSSFNKCYQYFPQATSWLSAENNCKLLGGNLVSVQNYFENTYITQLAAATSPGPPNYWIGLNLLFSNQWTWADGTNATYLNWYYTNPSGPEANQCAAVTDQYNRQWTKELCRSPKPYVCQIDPYYVANSCGTTPAPIGCPTGRCPDSSYVLRPDTCKCYKYQPGHKGNQLAAASSCSQEKATLAVIINEDENNFLSNFVLEYSSTFDDLPPSLWIGLYCSQYSTSSCYWDDRTPVNYTNFAGSPHPGQYVTLSPRNKFWSSLDYQNMVPFICQQNGIP